MMSLKELALMLIKHINNQATSSSEVVTKLTVKYGDKSIQVEDYSYFANGDYMSDKLLESLRCGRTLSENESEELSHFTSQKIITIQ